MKKLVSLLLALTLALSLAPAVFAANSEATTAADNLHGLGLFGGVGTNADGSINYDLDRVMTRNEAVTMLVRLLGKEDEAKAGTWQTPFTDVVEWAKPYVGYAYANGLTGGVGSDGKGGQLFGGGATTSATQYLTFVLRALGYNSSRDFQWDKAWELTDQLGITSGQYDADSNFERADAVIVSDNALKAAVNGSEKTLLDTLGLGADVKTEPDSGVQIDRSMPSNLGGESSENRQETVELILNTHTMKIHHSWCGSVPKISPQNYEVTTKSVEELEAMGYEKCKQNGDW